MTTVFPARRRPEVSGWSPLTALSSVDLPAPLTPTTPTRSPGREPPRDVVEDAPVTEVDGRVDEVDDVLAEPRASRTGPAPRRRAAAARPR